MKTKLMNSNGTFLFLFLAPLFCVVNRPHRRRRREKIRRSCEVRCPMRREVYSFRFLVLLLLPPFLGIPIESEEGRGLMLLLETKEGRPREVEKWTSSDSVGGGDGRREGNLGMLEELEGRMIGLER